jgi:hypothetical protein
MIALKQTGSAGETLGVRHLCGRVSKPVRLVFALESYSRAASTTVGSGVVTGSGEPLAHKMDSGLRYCGGVDPVTRSQPWHLENRLISRDSILVVGSLRNFCEPADGFLVNATRVRLTPVTALGRGSKGGPSKAFRPPPPRALSPPCESGSLCFQSTASLSISCF